MTGVPTMSTMHVNGPAVVSESALDTINKENEITDVRRDRRVTAYERLANDLCNDQRCMKEITLGKRIGFYRIRGELGTGNFSQVRLGIHALTKGTYRTDIDCSGLNVRSVARP